MGHPSYHLQPGTAFLDLGTTSYRSTDSLTIPNTQDALAISNNWTGLNPNTTSHWRLRFVDNQGRTFTACFFEPVRAGTVNASTVKLYKVGSTTAFSATVAYDAAPQKSTLNPSANLQPVAKNKAEVSAVVTDLAGNPFDQTPILPGNQPKSWVFTVRN